jgi:hypothetical protein
MERRGQEQPEHEASVEQEHRGPQDGNPYEEAVDERSGQYLSVNGAKVTGKALGKWTPQQG